MCVYAGARAQIVIVIPQSLLFKSLKELTIIWEGLKKLVTPPEIAWIVPIIIPFIMGLVVGFIVKHTIKLMFAIAALIILLVTFGFVSFTYQDIFDQAQKLLPKIMGTGSGFFGMLPYSSLTFIVGLVLGLWKG